MINNRLWESVNAEINASLCEEGDLILMKVLNIDNEEYYTLITYGNYDVDEISEIASYNGIDNYIILRITEIDERLNIISELKKV